MDLATLIIAAIAAAFTAAAALAALLTAYLARRDMQQRQKPYVTVGLPRLDYEHDGVIVPLKNLGLGPARHDRRHLR
jgi:hypothetical protein